MLGDEPALRIRVELDQEAVGVFLAIAFRAGEDTPTKFQLFPVEVVYYLLY